MRTLETVDRALRLLLAFDGEPDSELTVAAMAARLGVHRSSASRLAATLTDRGFLERAPDGEAFRLGPAIARLAPSPVAGRRLVAAARAEMEAVADATGETVVLSVLEGETAMDVAQVDGRHLVGARHWVGWRSPLHACSDGKVLLAFAGAATAGPLDAITPRTITSLDALEAEVAAGRARGWATVEGELEEGLNGVAVPVVDGGGRCVAALNVSGPAYRLPATRLDELGPDLQGSAAAIAARLGG
jgi:DNA-binding IclR family transcriptional regulator